MAIRVCALGRDLEDLSGGKGDLTEIGEKGLNLSGGQKARISLARAVYANADVYLLDDIIAAVDVEVAETLMEKCVMGALRNKTRVIVTHHPRWLASMDQIVVVQGSPGAGRVAHQGTFKELQAQDPSLFTESMPPTAAEEQHGGAMVRTVSEVSGQAGHQGGTLS